MLVSPVEVGESSMTYITVRDERIVTQEDVEKEDCDKGDFANHRIYIDIPIEKVDEIRKCYYSYSLTSTWDNDDSPPPSELPTIDLGAVVTTDQRPGR